MKKPVASINSPGRMTVLAALLAGLCAPALAASDVVISQVYGGGGNSGATLKQDFVELFNRSGSNVVIGGWSVQYASATGPSGSNLNWAVTAIPAGVTLEPGKYYMVRQAAGTNGTVDVVADTIGTIAMGAGAGKVALVSSTTALSGPLQSSSAYVDLVGFGVTNAGGHEGTGPTGTTSATAAALRKQGGCTDTDVNSADFTVTAPTPRHSGTAASVCPGVIVGPTAKPIVFKSTCPANLAFESGSGGSLILTASDLDSAITGVSITKGAREGILLSGFTAAAVGADASVTFGADANLPASTFPVDVTFTNNDNQSATCTVTVQASGTHTIPQIQGAGDTSPFADTVQTTEGVITMKFAGGYFIQDINGDGDPATSDGILVFSATTDSVVGDLVRVKGTVTEYKPAGATRSYTEITGVGSTAVKLSGGHPVNPTIVDYPRYSLDRYQGMLVSFPQPLVINQTTSLPTFGELMLASKRRETPTNLYRAGTPEAVAMAQANADDQVVLTDATNVTPTVTTLPYFDYTDKTVRVGDIVSNVVGAVDFGTIGNQQAGYKLQPLTLPTVSRANPRTAAPVVAAGNVKVASANVLNFFTTFTDGADVDGGTGKGCTEGGVSSASNCRGANNLIEFNRQRDKIVKELVALNADVVGLMEIQNNGDYAVDYLVRQLNGQLGAGTYGYVPGAPITGTDAIRVAMIYKPAAVSLVGAAMSDGDAVNNRPPLAQTFKAANGAKFSVVVNHLKSKIGCPSSGAADFAGNNDSGDGQACWNALRKAQALRLSNDFVPQVISASQDPDVLLIGDFNAHGMEDPITLLTDSASSPFVNELERFTRAKGEVVYSYVFNGLSAYLDHALATPSLDAQMVDAVEWHNNADEPAFIDYNTEGVFDELYVNNPYRASDHDPVVVSLNLAPTFVDATASFSIMRNGLAVNRITGKYSGTLSFTNKTAAPISGPFQVVFNGLTAGVTLDNKSGVQGGYPYLTVSNGTIAPGATVTVSMTFSNPSRAVVAYTPQIISGSF